MAVIAPFRALRPQGESRTWLVGDTAPALGATLRDLVARGALVRDRVPALYRCEVTFGPPEERRQARGFLCRLRCEDAEAILGPRAEPHVPVGSGAMAPDGECDLVPAVLRYADERGWVDEVLASNAFDEVLRCTTPDGAEHRLWRVDRAEGVQEAVAQFEDRALRVESGEGLLRAAAARFRQGGRTGDASVLVLLSPEGADAAPWRAGLVFSPRDEPRPRTWQEAAGDPGRAQWRTPAFG